MFDSTRSTTVRYETSAQEQTSVVRTRTICTMLEQGVICHLRGLRTGRYNTVILRKPTHFSPLPVAAPELRPRCFLLPGAFSGGDGVNTAFLRVTAELPALLRVVIRVVTVGPRRVAWSTVFKTVGAAIRLVVPRGCPVLGGRRRCRRPWREPWRSRCISTPGPWSWSTSPRRSGCR